ncbi:hypothetical protein H6B10_17400, partial [Gemmiger formicilis]|uniref:hypothetical protein n=1 Tax=Gemmiger formicilis TaxID=745368 RepID=UPI00195C03B2
IPAVDKVVAALEGDERTGAKIVRKALEAPLRQIAANAGSIFQSRTGNLGRVNDTGLDHILDVLFLLRIKAVV